MTNAKGGQSYHNYGLALDFCLLNEYGSASWQVNAQWKRAAEIGKSLGFAWGGDWKGSLIDYPHLEYTFGLSIQQLQGGKKPPTHSEGEANMIWPYQPEIIKERIYAENGQLYRCDRRLQQISHFQCPQ